MELEVKAGKGIEQPEHRSTVVARESKDLRVVLEMHPLRNGEAQVFLKFSEQAQRDELRPQPQPDFETTQGDSRQEEPTYHSDSDVTKQHCHSHTIRLFIAHLV